MNNFTQEILEAENKIAGHHTLGLKIKIQGEEYQCEEFSQPIFRSVEYPTHHFYVGKESFYQFVKKHSSNS